MSEGKHPQYMKVSEAAKISKTHSTTVKLLRIECNDTCKAQYS